MKTLLKRLCVAGLCAATVLSSSVICADAGDTVYPEHVARAMEEKAERYRFYEDLRESQPDLNAAAWDCFWFESEDGEYPVLSDVVAANFYNQDPESYEKLASAADEWKGEGYGDQITGICDEIAWLNPKRTRFELPTKSPYIVHEYGAERDQKPDDYVTVFIRHVFSNDEFAGGYADGSFFPEVNLARVETRYYSVRPQMKEGDRFYMDLELYPGEGESVESVFEKLLPRYMADIYYIKIDIHQLIDLGAAPIWAVPIVGDVNCDGVVNLRDLAVLLRYLAGWNVVADKERGDLDGNGKLTSRDAALLMRKLADGLPADAPPSLYCATFGHSLTSDYVTEVRHNVYEDSPRCERSVYRVVTCQRCGQIEKILISHTRTSACHG